MRIRWIGSSSHLNSVMVRGQEEARRGKPGCTNNKFYLQVQRIRNYRCRDGQGAEPGTIIVVLWEEIIWDVIKCFNSVDVIEIAGFAVEVFGRPLPVWLIGCLLCSVCWRHLGWNCLLAYIIKETLVLCSWEIHSQLDFKALWWKHGIIDRYHQAWGVCACLTFERHNRIM